MYEYGNNFLSETELEAVWNEIDLISGQMVGPEEAGAAVKDGKIMKRGKGFFVKRSIGQFVLPTINSLIEKIDTKSPFEYEDYTMLVNYYSDGDYYGEHPDDSVRTLNITLCRGDKKFSGGDFVFTETNEIIPFENNSYILFEGKMKHEVTPVTLNNDDGKSGRFSLTYFFY